MFNIFFTLLFLLGFQFVYLHGILWVEMNKEEQMQNYGVIRINCQVAEQLE